MPDRETGLAGILYISAPLTLSPATQVSHTAKRLVSTQGQDSFLKSLDPVPLEDEHSLRYLFFGLCLGRFEVSIGWAPFSS